jgi:hypothetical protein
MATVTTEVEVDLDDHDDDEIAAEFEARGLGAPDGDALHALRHSLVAGDIRSALIIADRLLTADATSDKAAAYERAKQNRDPATGRPLIL